MKRNLFLLIILLVIAGKSYSQACTTPQKLFVDTAWVEKEGQIGDPRLLFDEQTSAGDPKYGTAGTPSTTWFTDWQASNHPAYSYVNLQSLKQIKIIYLRDVNASGPFEVQYGTPGNWQPLFKITTSPYNEWVDTAVNITTQYLRFIRHSVGANVSEVVLYGCSLGDNQPPSVPGSLSSTGKSSSTVNLSWGASTDNVGVTGYDIFRNNALFSTVTATNATVTGLNASTAYLFKVRARDAAGNFSAFGNEISVTTDGTSTPEGAINYQRFDDIMGTAVTDLTNNSKYPNSPNVTLSLASMEVPSEVGANYGARMVGYITAPETGSYYFWISGDDNVELWLSTNNNPESKVKIASHTSWSNPREWNKFTTQKSTAINLTAGTKYYVEALLKENAGGDHMAVGWRKPSNGNGTLPAEVVPGSVLSRFFPLDTQAPSAPSGLVSTGKSTYSVSLSWSAATDNVGVSGYDVYYGKTKANKTLITTTSYTVSGLYASTAYVFTVKSKDAAGNTSSASNSVSVTTNVLDENLVQRIPIREEMVINEVGRRDDRGDFTLLFDEQSTIITQNPTGVPETHWRVGGDSTYFPAGLIIDFGREYEISKIYWFDGAARTVNGAVEIVGGKLDIEAGVPFDWTLKHQKTLLNNATWNNYTSTFRTRYLHIRKHSTAKYTWSDKQFSADAPLIEMVIYGKPVGLPPDPPINEHTPFNITMDKFIGGNSWWYEDTTQFNAVGHIRAYHDLKQSGSIDTIKPVSLQSHDKFYGRNKTANYEIFPCIQGNANGTNDKPNYYGSSLIPASYKAHADNMWQWAARYGRNTEIDSNLTRGYWYDQKKVGLDYIRYMENWNEPDKWWGGSNAQFSPYEFAAMTSADYDGHLGQLGPTYGMRNADPTMKLVMGGLAGPNIDFVKGMKLWSDKNRNGSFPADVLNFHHYTNTGGSAKKGISPEDGDLLGHLEKLVEYRNYYLPNKEIWLSEFGWDILPSDQLASGHTKFGSPGYTSEDLQAMWLARGFLIGAKAGMDRMHMYTIQDAGFGGLYTTSGMATKATQTVPSVKRKSWYFVSAMRKRLKGMVYIGEQESNDPNVVIYKFKSTTGSTGAYAVWCPTSNGTNVSYSLTMLGNPNTAKKIVLAKDNPSGIETTLPMNGNKALVDVSENPIFVLVNNMDGAAPSNARLGSGVSAEDPGEDDSSLSVYPNPSDGSFNIAYNEEGSGTLEVFDLSGKTLLKKPLHSGVNTIQTKALRKGVYILKINSGKTYMLKKILIE